MSMTPSINSAASPAGFQASKPMGPNLGISALAAQRNPNPAKMVTPQPFMRADTAGVMAAAQQNQQMNGTPGATLPGPGVLAGSPGAAPNAMNGTNGMNGMKQAHIMAALVKEALAKVRRSRGKRRLKRSKRASESGLMLNNDNNVQLNFGADRHGGSSAMISSGHTSSTCSGGQSHAKVASIGSVAAKFLRGAGTATKAVGKTAVKPVSIVGKELRNDPKFYGASAALIGGIGTGVNAINNMAINGPKPFKADTASTPKAYAPSSYLEQELPRARAYRQANPQQKFHQDISDKSFDLQIGIGKLPTNEINRINAANPQGFGSAVYYPRHKLVGTRGDMDHESGIATMRHEMTHAQQGNGSDTASEYTKPSLLKYYSPGSQRTPLTRYMAMRHETEARAVPIKRQLFEDINDGKLPGVSQFPQTDEEWRRLYELHPARLDHLPNHGWPESAIPTEQRENYFNEVTLPMMRGLVRSKGNAGQNKVASNPVAYNPEFYALLQQLAMNKVPHDQANYGQVRSYMGLPDDHDIDDLDLLDADIDQNEARLAAGLGKIASNLVAAGLGAAAGIPLGYMAHRGSRPAAAGLGVAGGMGLHSMGRAGWDGNQAGFQAGASATSGLAGGAGVGALLSKFMARRQEPEQTTPEGEDARNDLEFSRMVTASAKSGFEIDSGRLMKTAAFLRESDLRPGGKYGPRLKALHERRGEDEHGRVIQQQLADEFHANLKHALGQDKEASEHHCERITFACGHELTCRCSKKKTVKTSADLCPDCEIEKQACCGEEDRGKPFKVQRLSWEEMQQYMADKAAHNRAHPCERFPTLTFSEKEAAGEPPLTPTERSHVFGSGAAGAIAGGLGGVAGGAVLGGGLGSMYGLLRKKKENESRLGNAFRGGLMGLGAGGLAGGAALGLAGGAFGLGAGAGAVAGSRRPEIVTPTPAPLNKAGSDITPLAAAFLNRCIDRGMTRSQIEEGIEKLAEHYNDETVAELRAGLEKSANIIAKGLQFGGKALGMGGKAVSTVAKPLAKPLAGAGSGGFLDPMITGQEGDLLGGAFSSRGAAIGAGAGAAGAGVAKYAPKLAPAANAVGNATNRAMTGGIVGSAVDLGAGAVGVDTGGLGAQIGAGAGALKLGPNHALPFLKQRGAVNSAIGSKLPGGASNWFGRRGATQTAQATSEGFAGRVLRPAAYGTAAALPAGVAVEGAVTDAYAKAKDDFANAAVTKVQEYVKSPEALAEVDAIAKRELGVDLNTAKDFIAKGKAMMDSGKGVAADVMGFINKATDTILGVFMDPETLASMQPWQKAAIVLGGLGVLGGGLTSSGATTLAGGAMLAGGIGSHLMKQRATATPATTPNTEGPEGDVKPLPDGQTAPGTAPGTAQTPPAAIPQRDELQMQRPEPRPAPANPTFGRGPGSGRGGFD
jgi:hypothetical protein